MEAAFHLATVLAVMFIGFVTSKSNDDKLSCKEKAEKAIGSNYVGAFIPKCKPDGNFVPLQCYGSTGTCWCVDKYGEMVPEHLIKYTECNNPCFKRVLENQPPSILVHGAAQYIDMGIPTPDCDANGYFKPKQCDQRTCWCVDKLGNKNDIVCE